MNEEELKKGCGKDLKRKAFGNPSLSLYCGIEVFVSESVGLKVILCPTCQAKLEGFQKGKLEQKKEELELLIKINGLWFDDEEKGMINIIQKRIKQLQKEIGGMK
jgi:uncharacterized protein YbaR (Trm112 family)